MTPLPLGAMIYVTKQPEQFTDSSGQAGAETAPVSAAVVEAGRVALIAWHEGSQDFADGARQIYLAMRAAEKRNEVDP